MSGLFGIIHFEGCPVAQTDLESLASTLSHRGPDGSNIWRDDAVGLGQLMLHTTSEALNEILPWEDPCSGLLITADARIDNRNELIKALCLDARAEPPLPDSQIIVAAFRKWGDTCASHLIGDFAFAIWDKCKRRLYIARDHMGLRPFYYYCSNKCFVFASAAVAITEVSGVPQQVNQGRVADFLINELEGINNTNTFFKDIYRLPPAHFGVFECGRFTLQRYWKPDPQRQLVLACEADYTDALQEVLTQSVKDRMRCQLPASSMLSGGVDSSTIVGIARQLCQENGMGPFRSYAGVSDDTSSCIESRYIQMMIDYGGLDPVFIRPSDVANYSSGLTHGAHLMEDPFDKSMTMVGLIYLCARQHGSVVVMDGVDGDMVAGLTTGYPAFLFRQGNIRHALHEIGEQRKNNFQKERGLITAYAQALRPVFTPSWARRLKASRWPDTYPKECQHNAMLSDSFAKKVKLHERWQEYRGQSIHHTQPSLQQTHADRIAVPYLTAAIERYSRLASYYGVEARQPFHDKRVVELCLSLPWQQKAQHGWMKYGLRNVLQRLAPPEVAWRSEFDSIMWKFGVSLDDINKKKKLATIAKNREKLLNILDEKLLDKTLARYANGDKDAGESVDNLATLLTWLQGNKLEI